MRKARALIPIPQLLAEAIDRLAGHKQRSTFIINLLEREVRRCEQRNALADAAGSWTDESHPELAGGADRWIREMRQESAKRLEEIDFHREA